MRVLILAETCNPAWPSLPAVAYRASRAIAERVDALVVTHPRNRAEIDAAGFGKARVEYIDTEAIAGPMHRLEKLLRGGTSVGWTTSVAMSYLPYVVFEWKVWQRYGEELRRGGFDVIHRVSPMSPTIPSPLASWSDVPFVLGPLNGGLPWPQGFAQELAREREWLAYVRGAFRFLPYHRTTYRRARAILASFDHTIRDLPRGDLAACINFPEVGVDAALFPGRRSPAGSAEPLRFLFVGRLVPYKCPDVAVTAFARSPLLQQHRLCVLGDGPERPRLEALIREHRLESCVEITGWRPQAEVGRLIAEQDVLVFPSVRELGAGVVVECMASGLACVVVDYGGPGGLVDATRGIAVPLGSKDALAERFRVELEGLVRDRERIGRLGAAAREFALREFSWESKAARTEQIYEWVTGRRATRPDWLPVPERS
jgi:glycosyltransferase involved in cell wall biosynthesis